MLFGLCWCMDVVVVVVLFSFKSLVDSLVESDDDDEDDVDEPDEDDCLRFFDAKLDAEA